MSRRSAAASPWLWLLAVAALVAITVSLMGRQRPYATDSVDDDGYRGLVLILEEYGAEVDETDLGELGRGPGEADRVVFVPVAAGLSDDRAAALWDLAASGRRVVVGGGIPDSGTGGGLESIGSVFGGPATFAGCTMDDLDGIDAIAVGGPTQVFDPTTVDQSCLGDGAAALVAQVRVGDGEMIAIGTPDLFTNVSMGAPAPGEQVSYIPDNAALAQRLLAPEGVDAVDLVRSGGTPPVAVTGQKGITDFMSSGVKLALGEVVVALVILAWWRGRRHGAPVVEPQPVEVASSELVDAVGNLLERQGDPSRAAARIRDRTARELRSRLALPPDVDVATLSRIVAGRTGRQPAEIEAVLADGPILDSDALLELVHQLDNIRTEALHDRVPAHSDA